jgi:maltose O-acetyltransferase
MKTGRRKMLDGELYAALDVELGGPGAGGGRARARDRCQALAASREAEAAGRRRLPGGLFGAGEESVWRQPPFFYAWGTSIALGERAFFTFTFVVPGVCRGQIGSVTLFGPAVQIHTATHPFNAGQHRRQESGKPVPIGSDVWVGGGAIILPGECLQYSWNQPN